MGILDQVFAHARGGRFLSPPSGAATPEGFFIEDNKVYDFGTEFTCESTEVHACSKSLFRALSASWFCRTETTLVTFSRTGPAT
ncbi:MAG: hypothetical protein LW875_05325 [Proteobacteria bacterium]|jgi:hypothetical protein|nr:hypothetical protein [Pseudomonadota bacterium]